VPEESIIFVLSFIC